MYSSSEYDSPQSTQLYLPDAHSTYSYQAPSFTSRLSPPLLLSPGVPANPASIEHLSLSQLLQNPHVLDLHQKLMRYTALQLEQHEEMQKLRREVAALKEENLQLRHLNRHQRSASTVSSISPLDSISQVDTPADTVEAEFRKNSAICPKGIDPKKVIWSLEDARADPRVGMTSANPGRPNMAKAIRKSDGSLIKHSEYKAIIGIAKDVIRRQLDPLPIPHEWQSKTRAKRYYQEVHPLAWTKAVEELEQREVLLRYCSGSWKAEHILKKVLRGPSESSQPAVTRVEMVERDVSDAAGEATTPNSDKRKRAASEASSKSKKRSKQNKDKGTGGRREDNDRSKDPLPNSALSNPGATAGAQGTTPAVSSAGRSASIHDRISTLGSASSPSSIRSGSGGINKNSQPLAQAAASDCHEEGASVEGCLEPIDISFIEVRDSVADIQGEVKAISSLPECVDSLLQVLESSAATTTTDSESSAPSSDSVTRLLKRLQSADPNDPTLSSDNNNANFGHSHFTGGDLTITKALDRWESVGSVRAACQLLAAALKIVKISRHVCFHRSVSPSSLMSEVYLGLLIERLWKIWEDAHPNETAVNGSAVSREGFRKQLLPIRKDTLQTWAKEHEISTTETSGKECNKEALITRILASSVTLSPETISGLKSSTAAARKPRSQRKAQDPR